MMQVLLIGAIECVAFILATINIRACAKGHVKATLVTDGLIALVGFTLIKMVADAETTLEMVSYVTGACLGSLIGMWITKGWRDEG